MNVVFEVSILVCSCLATHTAISLSSCVPDAIVCRLTTNHLSIQTSSEGMRNKNEFTHRPGGKILCGQEECQEIHFFCPKCPEECQCIQFGLRRSYISTAFPLQPKQTIDIIYPLTYSPCFAHYVSLSLLPSHF